MPVSNSKTSFEQTAFFLRLSKIGSAKQTREQQFARLSSSRQHELEELYNEHVPNGQGGPSFSVDSSSSRSANDKRVIAEYSMNGYTFKVHVLEDTEL